MNFDLLTEEWIPALRLDGSTRDYSITSIFKNAADIERLMHDNPLVVASIKRLLLAVLYRSYGALDQEDWEDLFCENAFDNTLFDYLASDKSQGRFDLFSKTAPFFQTAEFTKEKNATTSVKKLSPHFATANNKTLFNHIADTHEFSMSPKEAAQALLVCQYFSLGGGVSGSSTQFQKHPNLTNSPLVGGAVVMVEGENLFQTLLLNLHKPKNSEWLESDKDLPVWEQNEIEPPKARASRGLTDYLTWRARHVRLLPDDEGRVSQMHFAQGLPVPKEFEREPYFSYRLNKKDAKRLPIRLSFERTCWRDTANLYQLARAEKTGVDPQDLRAAGIQLLASNDSDEIQKIKLNCLMIGLDNNKANPLSWFEERLPLPVNLLEKDRLEQSKFSKNLVKGMATTEAIHAQLVSAVRVFATHLLPEGTRPQEISSRLESINPSRYFWPKLNDEFEQFIWCLSEDKNDALSSWRIHCSYVAEEAFNLSTTSWCYGSARVKKGLSLAKQQLEIDLFKQEKSLSVYWTEETQSLINTLHGWRYAKRSNSGALAALKRALDLQTNSQLSVIPHLAPLLSDSKDKADLQCFVAALFASHSTDKQFAKPQSFGVSWRSFEGSEREGLSFRFECLINATGKQVKTHLRQMIQILKTKNVPIDYCTLLEDLYQWDSNDKHVQLRWAKDFWGKKAIPNQITTEQTES